MKVWDSNVLTALHIAIDWREKYESRWCGSSALLAGWKEMRDALLRGETVEIRTSEGLKQKPDEAEVRG